MGNNLTGQLISATYEQLVQISGSILTDGTGSNINSLTVTASNATTAVSATSASFATTAASATTATNATSASFAATASFAQNFNPAATASYALFAMDADLLDGNDGLFYRNASNLNTGTVPTGRLSGGYSINVTGSLLGTASFATSASTANSATTSTTATTSSYASNADLLDGLDSTFFRNASNLNAGTVSASRLSGTYTIDISGNAATATFADNASSAGTATTASFATTVAQGITINATSITASGGQFTNLVATSASIGYLNVTTGSAVIIGDEFIILNADTPAAPFAGIKVYDTGSASTASIEWNGNTDNWIVVEEGGTSAMILTGLTGSKGAEAAPTVNALLKGTGNHTLTSSAVIDNGTSVSIYGLTYPNTDGTEGQVLQTDGAGNVVFGEVETLYEVIYAGENLVKTDPVYLSGSVGANPIAFKADAGNAAKMPAIYVMDEAVTAGSTGRAIALGLISGIDLTGYEAGDEVFVGVGGGWTDTRPTGSAIVQPLGVVTKGGAGGKGFVNNPGPATLPNLNSGSVFVGGADSVPVAVATSSLSVASASFATTASFASTAVTASYVLNAVSASFATTASYFDLSAVTQNAVFSGSVRGDVSALSISSNTASIDASTGNFFTLALVSGSNTHLGASNINPGQTINLRITQPATGSGTLSYSSTYDFAGGIPFTASLTASQVDIMTFIAFDNTTLFGTGLKNFS